MNIEWYGHAAFKITTEKGIRIIIDPYESGFSGGTISYRNIDDEADIVITSHDHGDHNYIKSIRGKYEHIKKQGSYEIKGVKLQTLPTFHDTASGKERGDNLLTIISADGIKLLHLGDLGHDLDPETLKKIGKVDVLLLPVGGFYTIDAQAATKVMNNIRPSITIPMHYRTEKCSFPITTVAEFTRGKKNVQVLPKSEMKITAAALPKEPEIIVLQHSL
ncbi:MAG: MBL fold metallo-hydrolase [Syntrophales bacterium]|jgi:L-ascorbate metabolism protein UlaG (beta-lactamase superfamily)